MSESDKLIEILEASVSKNGEKPLTNLWLLRILKKAKRMQIAHDERMDALACCVEVD